MLKVSSLSKYFDDITAIEDLSFEVGSGEIVGLLGANGAGKTTTLRCLAGILKPHKGEILFDGIDLQKDPLEAKKRFAFVPEMPGQYELLTVEEHVKFTAMCYNSLEIYEQKNEELLKRFKLFEKRNALVATLSKGMRQKLAFICAFIHQAKIFLLDEPILGIDPIGIKEVKDLILKAKKEHCAILLSTHVLSLAEEICDRVIILRQGKKHAEGTLRELEEQAKSPGSDLENIFLKLVIEEKEEHLNTNANHPKATGGSS